MAKVLDQRTVDQLVKLFPMLSSSIDNERLATVEAILRVLKAGKFDLHDLASHFKGGGEKSFLKKKAEKNPEPPKKRPEPPPTSGVDGWMTIPLDVMWALLEAAREGNKRAHSTSINQFLNDMEAKAGRGYDPMYISKKQYDWLSSLVKRASWKAGFS